MGVVYLAEDLTLRRRVALKVLPAAVAADPARRVRFLREARAAPRWRTRAWRRCSRSVSSLPWASSKAIWLKPSAFGDELLRQLLTVFMSGKAGG